MKYIAHHIFKQQHSLLTRYEILLIAMSLSVVVFCVSHFILPMDVIFNRSLVIYFQFIVIGALCIWEIYYNLQKYGFSIFSVHFIFLFVFIYMAGSIQYAYSIWQWRQQFGETDVILANFVILFWQIMFVFFYKHASNALNFNCLKKITTSGWKCGIFCICGGALALYIIANGGVMQLLSRTAEKFTLSGGIGPLGLIEESIKSGFAIVLLAFTIIYYKRKRSSYSLLLLGIALFVSLVLVPVFGAARNRVAIVYLGSFLLFSKRIKQGSCFIVMILIAIFVIFPILELTRNVSLATLTMANLSDAISNIPFMLASGHFDAYTMIVSTVHFVREHGITYGRQLLGVCLFFIPRSFWPEKPIGSGATIIEYYRGSDAFSNVSCPIIAEGYINFGIVGVFFFAFLLGSIAGIVDHNFWTKTKMTKLNIFYPYIIPYVIFMSRGDMLSSFSFFIGMLCTYWIISSYVVVYVK